jgi:predicted DCC family thiol-disulfide oxidoreductase YuxK
MSAVASNLTSATATAAPSAASHPPGHRSASATSSRRRSMIVLSKMCADGRSYDRSYVDRDHGLLRSHWIRAPASSQKRRPQRRTFRAIPSGSAGQARIAPSRSTVTSVHRPILIFDGDCGFCTTTAILAKRWLRLESVEAWQMLELEPLGLTPQECGDALQWVDIDGVVSSAERAVVEALRHAGIPWSTLGNTLSLPGIRALSGYAYRWVARNRDRLPGGTPACRSAQVEDR